MTTIEQKEQAARNSIANEVYVKTESDIVDLMNESFVQGAEWAESLMRWVPVTEALPEENRDCLFIVDRPCSYYHGRVYGGCYTGDPTNKLTWNEFSTPENGFSASHWQYAPKSIVPNKDENR